MTPIDKLKAAIVAYTNEENFDVLNEYTADIIRQTLETAAEKALCDVDDDGCTVFVDKHSILNTFEQTYKTFKQ